MFKARMELLWFNHKSKLTALMIILPLLVAGGWFIYPAAELWVADALETRRFNRLGREEFLYDWDYMMRRVEAGFPFADAIYEHRGVDVWQLAAHTRALIADPETHLPDPYAFFDLIHENFFAPVGAVGHLIAFSQVGYLGRLNGWVLDSLAQFELENHLNHMLLPMPMWLFELIQTLND